MGGLLFWNSAYHAVVTEVVRCAKIFLSLFLTDRQTDRQADRINEWEIAFVGKFPVFSFDGLTVIASVYAHREI